MRNRIASIVVATATLFAGAAHAAVAKKEIIKVDRAAIVGGSVVPPGSYGIELASEPDTVRFVQGGRTVAEVPCKIGVATVVYPGNAVHYRTTEKGQDRLIKIVLADSKLAIELNAPAALEADVPIAKAGDRQ